MIKVRVPATSANIGAGFDCMGVAVNLYNTIEVAETDGGLKICGRNMANYIPRGDKNLVYKAVMLLFDEVGYRAKGLKITQRSDIPITRGLGSSSACIIGGMLAANVISGRKMNYPDILNLALKMEGHADNITAALYGGLCVSMINGEKIIHKSIKLDSAIKFAVIVPDYFMGTKKSRKLLPEKVSYNDAVFNISRAAVLTASFMDGKLDNLREAVQDRMHQQYRKVNVAHFDEIFDISYKFGSQATYLSGSGPSIVCILNEKYNEFQSNMNGYFKNNNIPAGCRILSVDNLGAIVRC